ncbi:beta/gamma crystallin-related protein [Brevundimonas sp. Root1279]|uniref:beta/gamma crystallin-related protein n=1 Tax=Brevundimonas sp. Root1279 TaxID=1736443 RepID=UPI0006F7D61D|nr:beta/gamma crystallin-related protein [Brevundimonas sp. Root1279]KQW79594.1 hypothetical protein ASC65_13615 [Brevundimonas sp. Root1279]
MLIQALVVAAALSGGGQQAAPYAPGGQERVAPRGDYRDSCSGAFVNRGRLYADCRDRRGEIRGTSIELNRCSDYEIRNNDGLLVCGPVRGQWEDRPGGGGNGNGGWNGGGGSWGRNSVTVYRDANFRGTSMRFNNEIPNLANSGLNDAISSFELRGDWEFCTDAYFRGQCRIFRSDVSNLRSLGMNDRISSLRPVRGGR